MLYEDVGAQPWESVDGCQRKDVADGIVLWNVDTNSNLPLEHAEQTLFILKGSGKLRVTELIFILSPGIVMVLPRSSESVVMPYPGDPLMILEVAASPRTLARGEEENAARYEAAVQPLRTVAEQDISLNAEPTAGADVEEDVPKVAIFEPALPAAPSSELPPPDPVPGAPASPGEQPIVQEVRSASGGSSLARYLASSPVSGRTRHPVPRSTRE